MERIYIADATLREGAARQEGVLSFKERIEIAKQLDKLCVDVIETAPITAPKMDTLLLRTIGALLKNSALACPVGTTEAEADMAWEAVANAAKPRLVVSLPVSPMQMEYACHLKPAQLLELVKKQTAYAVSLCPDVEFIAADATRGETAFLIEVVKRAVKAGAGTVTVCDTAGLLLPAELEQLISALYTAVPELKDKRLSVECGDALKMANACVFSAIKAGARQIKTSSAGNGMPSLDTVIAALLSRGDSLGMTNGVNHLALNSTLGQVDRRLNLKRKDKTPFDDIIGERTQDMLLDATADQNAVSGAVGRLGYELTDEDLAKVFEEFQRVAVNKQVGAKELDTIVATVALQVPQTYRLISYVTNSGNLITATAQIALEKNGRQVRAVSCGDGPIDAAFVAIEQIIGHHYELDDFQIQSVTEGREAMGEALVKLRSEGKLFSGNGISTDIIGASIKAYLSALNKILYEKSVD